MPVLSQTSNVIFLVGAAWAPSGFLAADRWVRCRRRWAVPGLTLVLALQVLGGDPEAAYVTLACAVGYAAGLAAARPPSVAGRWLRWVGVGLIPTYLGLLGLSWWSARAIREVSVTVPGMPQPWKPPSDALVAAAWGMGAAVLAWRARARSGGDARGFGAMIGGLIGAAALALAISGAQLLPVLEYAGQSFRAAASEGFHDIYPYSAHPLQLLDTIWPSVYGTARRRLSFVAQRAAAEARQPPLDAVALPGRADAGPGIGRGGLRRRSPVANLAERGGGREPAGGSRLLREPGPLGALRAGLGRRARAARAGLHLAAPHRRMPPRRRWRCLLVPGLGLARLPFVPVPAEAACLLGARHLGTRGHGLGPAGWRAGRAAPRSSRRCLLAASLLALAAVWLGAGPLRAWFDRLADDAPVVRRAS